MTETTTKDKKELSQDIQGVGVSRVYAEALLEQAFQRNQAEEILEELESLLNDVLTQHQDLEQLLTGDDVSRDKKKQVIETVFAGRVNELVANFLQILNDHQRLSLLRPIIQLYREKLDQRRGRILVQVKFGDASPGRPARSANRGAEASVSARTRSGGNGRSGSPGRFDGSSWRLAL